MSFLGVARSSKQIEWGTQWRGSCGLVFDLPMWGSEYRQHPSEPQG